MNTLEILFNVFFAILGAFLSVVLGKLLKQNGRVLKKMDEGFRIIAKLIVTENEKTRKSILKELRK
jgi:glucose-6-phosphate-specific signal transduction histidine kinase